MTLKMVRTAALCLLFASACSAQSAGEQAEERHKKIASVGDVDRTCQSAKKVADAYAEEGNRQKFKEWQAHSKIVCGMAGLSI